MKVTYIIHNYAGKKEDRRAEITTDDPNLCRVAFGLIARAENKSLPLHLPDIGITIVEIAP